MRVYYINLAKISRNFMVLALLAATAILFSMIVKQSIPSTASASGKTIYKVQTKQKAIAITFNVKSGTEISPAVQTLEECQGKATFFVDPAWARENSKAIRHISLKGHEIGILLGSRNTNSADLPKHISESKEVLAQLTGSVPSLVRFNGPDPGSSAVNTAYSLGYQIIGSTATLNDTSNKDINWLQPGNIVCISLDNAGNNNQKRISDTVSALQKEHFSQVTLSELLAYGPGIVR